MTSPEDDVGLAAERTMLAWQRTALAYAVSAAIALRVVPSLGSRLAVGGGLLVGAVVAAAASRHVAREAPRREPWVLALAAATIAASVLGVVTGMLPVDRP